MNRTEARQIVKDAILSTVPGADLDHLAPNEAFRDALEMDSLDFQSFVETLVERTGRRIDEDDYPALTTLSDCTDFLLSRAS